jgi:hypothetical protein
MYLLFILHQINVLGNLADPRAWDLGVHNFADDAYRRGPVPGLD